MKEMSIPYHISNGTARLYCPLTNCTFNLHSLDDMIKNRRSVTPKATARKVSTADKAVAKGKAARNAGANARRGITKENKPTAMEVEREITRQSKMSVNNRAGNQKKETQPAKVAQRTRRVADVKIKVKNDVQKQQTKQNNQKNNNNPISPPPTWIGGTRRPPSAKAVTAAVSAMQANGFKVPKGMQMVISFAPAPDAYPAPTLAKTTHKKTEPKKNNANNGNNAQGNKQPNQNNANQGQSENNSKPRGRSFRGKK